ncbi:Hypothetical predicted protein [Olea europaea subsp. europaea]|uniref:TRF2/HOY1 PH-like domain-containing protein n=1 Tax=Olea europaea subsp. europaea TaxID=158383 RepID=A0A8S0UBF0_OLEEU|nr:Hypothetical predicted protein [Olea europaea subsp. europaea]
MVQLMKCFETIPFSGSNTSVMNMDKSSKGDYGRLIKRSRSSQNPSPSVVNQWSSEDHESSRPSSQCSPLHEPSPLGLRLNKTQSLLELIEKRLSEENSASLTAKSSKNLNSPIQNDARRTITSGANDKLKASNFPASLLRIGSWQLAQPPIFFIETNPQPRKRTIWKPTSDFPGEEASKNRQNPNPMTARHVPEETSSSSSGTILLIFNVNRTSPVKLIFK